jgi:hypothetical protein
MTSSAIGVAADDFQLVISHATLGSRNARPSTASAVLVEQCGWGKERNRRS